jgi:hypothetical protein
MTVGPNDIMANALRDDTRDRYPEGEAHCQTSFGALHIDVDLDSDHELDLQYPPDGPPDHELKKIEDLEDEASDYSPTKRKVKKPSFGRPKHEP